MEEFDSLGARQLPNEHVFVDKDWQGNNLYENQYVYVDQSDNYIQVGDENVVEYIKENYTLDEIVCELIAFNLEEPFGLTKVQL